MLKKVFLFSLLFLFHVHLLGKDGDDELPKFCVVPTMQNDIFSGLMLGGATGCALTIGSLPGFLGGLVTGLIFAVKQHNLHVQTVTKVNNKILDEWKLTLADATHNKELYKELVFVNMINPHDPVYAQIKKTIEQDKTKNKK